MVMAHSVRGCTCGWQVKLCDHSLTHAIPQYCRDECRTQYKALYKCPVNSILHYFIMFYLPGFTFLVPAHPGSPRQKSESRKTSSSTLLYTRMEETGHIDLSQRISIWNNLSPYEWILAPLFFFNAQ